MRLAALVALAALAAGCPTASEGPDVALPVLEGLGEGVIVPRYEVFETEMAEAAAAIAAFCDAPEQGTLDAARDALGEAHVAWKRSDVIPFGPARDLPWTIRARLDLWPVRADNVQELLDSGEPVTPEALNTTLNAAKGLPAIAWLLWSEDDSLAAFTDPDDGARRCEVTAALADDAAARGAEMVVAWQPDGDGWLSEFVAPPGPLAEFENSYEVVAELVNRMIFTVENARLLKMARPAGLEDGSVPEPDQLEARWGGGSLAAIKSNLDGVADVFHGRWSEADVPGIITLVGDDRRDQLASDFDATFFAGMAALDAIPAPLAVAIVDHPDSVDAAVSALFDLQAVLQADLAQALGVTVRFNDTDGD